MSRAVEQAIRLVGYFRGPAALSQLLSPALSAGGDLAGCASALADASDALADIVRYAEMLSPRGGSDGVLQTMLQQSVRRRAAERRPEPLDDYQQAVQAMLKCINFQVGPPNPDDVSPGMAPFHSSAFELHSTEEFLLHIGGNLPYAQALLATQPPSGWGPEVGEGGPDA
jgi:hypothetical protein